MLRFYFIIKSHMILVENYNKSRQIYNILFPIYTKVDAGSTIDVIDANSGDDIIDANYGDDIIDALKADIKGDAKLVFHIVSDETFQFHSYEINPSDINKRYVSFDVAFEGLNYGRYTAFLYAGDKLVGKDEMRLVEAVFERDKNNIEKIYKVNE